jgi:hypothetical protein
VGELQRVGTTMLFQDWITLRSQVTQTFVQSHACYLDLGDVDDIVLYLDVPQQSATGSAVLSYQTGPSSDDASFATIVPPFSLAASASPRVDRVLAAYAAVPLSRFLRWSVTANAPSGVVDVTFRISIATYAPGG